MGKFIGLGIITVAIIAAIIVTVCLVKFIISYYEDYFKYSKNPKPWLRSREWVEKKIIWKGMVRGSLTLAFFMIAIVPFLIAIIASIYNSTTPPLIFIVFFMILISIFGFFMYRWLQSRKFGKSICYIETLPGQIGGTFKAKVEMYLPDEHPKDIDLRLTLLAYDFPGQRSPREWTIEQVVRQEAVESRGEKKYIVPVLINIPIDPPLGKYKSAWLLILKCNAPGIDYYSNFNVPVFDVKKYK